MVWACGENGLQPLGQKGVDLGCKWRAGMRETEVRLDAWCEGGLATLKKKIGRIDF